MMSAEETGKVAQRVALSAPQGYADFACPYCGKQLMATKTSASDNIKCPECKNLTAVDWLVPAVDLTETAGRSDESTKSPAVRSKLVAIGIGVISLLVVLAIVAHSHRAKPKGQVGTDNAKVSTAMKLMVHQLVKFENVARAQVNGNVLTVTIPDESGWRFASRSQLDDVGKKFADYFVRARKAGGIDDADHVVVHVINPDGERVDDYFR